MWTRGSRSPTTRRWGDGERSGLAIALARRADATLRRFNAAQLDIARRISSVLLVVDQLDELFTLASAGERDTFLAALRALRAERRCAVIVTLRADFGSWPSSSSAKESKTAGCRSIGDHTTQGVRLVCTHLALREPSIALGEPVRLRKQRADLPE